MNQTVLAAFSALALCAVLVGPAFGVDVLTYHNDLARTGLNANETQLTLANVNTNTFGKLFSHAVDGYVYAQPLYKANVAITNAGTHNVVFVATLHDGVYAFDADDNRGANADPLWYVSFIDPANGTNTVPYTDATNTDDIKPEFGIVGTPVIDPVTGTLFVVARTKEISAGVTNYVQRLHALDIGSGTEQFGGPVVIQASVPGTGYDNDSAGGMVPFTALLHNQRPGLLLLNGVIYIAWGSHADVDPFHGWVIGYNATNLQQVAAFNVTPNGGQAGIWAAGAAPAADTDGNIYVTTGNGSNSVITGGTEYGDCVIKLSSTNGLTAVDWFAPFNQTMPDPNEVEIGSGGVLLLPDQPGPHPHLAVVAGKGGPLYLLDRDNLGHYGTNDSQVVQVITNAFSTEEFGVATYWNGRVYFMGVHDPLVAYQLNNGMLSTNPVSQSTIFWNFPGSTPSISANGLTNAIVWILQNDGFDTTNTPATLHAFDANDLSRELYNSDQAGTRDQPGIGVKFTVPTVANGKVYVGTHVNTNGELDVYGLFAAAPPPAVDTSFRTTRATLTLGASAASDRLTLSGVYDPTGLALNSNSVVSVSFGDYEATVPSNGLVNLKFKAKASPANTLTALSFTPKSRTFKLSASGFTLTNGDPFSVTVTVDGNLLGPDLVTFPVSTNVGTFRWSYGNQLPDVDQFFLGKSKLTTNSFALSGTVNILSRPNMLTNPVSLRIGSFDETLATNGWVRGTGDLYTYTRPPSFTGAVQSMTIDLDLGRWSAKGSGAHLASLSTNAPTSFRLEVGSFTGEYSATLSQKGTSFSY